MKAILLALFLVYASSFVLEKSDILAHGFKLVPFKRENIVSEQVQDVNDLPWPFTVCGAAADWEARSLALSNNPTVKL